MEIEEMQKFWDSENQQTLYTINEDAMQKIIKNKKRLAIRRISRIEKIFIAINIVLPIFLYFVTSLNDQFTYSMKALIVYHIFTAIYVYYFRQNRLNNADVHGRSMSDDLDEAIFHAEKQAQLTKMLLSWYIIIAGALSVGNFLELKLDWYYSLGLGLFFLFAYFAGMLEQRHFHEKKRDELIEIREKIIND